MASDASDATAADERVTWPQLIAYGMGGVIPIALFNIAPQLIQLLGNISVGLSAFWLGVIMIMPRLWDAFFDPYLGHLSDNTSTRWGRRRPYLLVGGIVAALSFAAMWWIPRGELLHALVGDGAAAEWAQYGFVLALMLLFFTACAVFEIPHGALGMEMSTDYHERTRLFSAKSFLGNLFAMGSPWLIVFAGWDIFKNGGDLIDGMRRVALVIAAVLVPLTVWLFVILREPGIAAAERPKSNFWQDMRATFTNRTFLSLVVIIFTLAMGFNFVSIFSYYITIFYLYGGDPVTAGAVLGVNGTVWAITALVAVWPLNWLARRFGKSRTLLVAILLMCAAQLSKIVCYDPQQPYLVLIPTMLLSAGMLMFFTLGSSMVGDVCDEDELRSGVRSEGTYYSVFWWFIKVGSAFASLVMGALLVFTGFDEHQNVRVDMLRADIEAIRAAADAREAEMLDQAARLSNLKQAVTNAERQLTELRGHLSGRASGDTQHEGTLLHAMDALAARLQPLRASPEQFIAKPQRLQAVADFLLEQTVTIKQQSPRTLFRLRLVEIALPLLLSVVSIVLTLRYPLTESRCYEIKELLKQRRAAIAG